MDIILLERVEKLGQMGDMVNVKPGYARNFLLPRGKALRATKENKEYFEKQKKEIEAKNLKEKKEAEAVADKIKNTTLIIIRQAGDTGRLYGSVSSKDLAASLNDKGIKINFHQVKIPTPIKELGIYEDIKLELHSEVIKEIRVNVARSEDEAKTQEETLKEELNKKNKKEANARKIAEVKAEEKKDSSSTDKEVTEEKAEEKEDGKGSKEQENSSDKK